MPKDNSTKTKARRRADAEARQKSYDALSTAQKLQQTVERRGDSKREAAKLSKLNA